MAGNMRINWKRLILALVVSLGAGVISWLLTGNSMEMYANIKKPSLFARRTYNKSIISINSQ